MGDQATEVVEQTTEQRAEAEKKAEASFATGFQKVVGKPDAGTNTATESTETTTGAAPVEGAVTTGEQASTAAVPAPAKAEVPAAAAAAPAEDPWKDVPKVVRDQLEALPGRLRNIEGHIGGLKSTLDTALATAKAATSAGKEAPTATQIATAAVSTEKWKKLQEDFPDWTAALDEKFESLRQQQQPGAKVDVAGLTKEVTDKVVSGVKPDLQAGFQQARQYAQVDIKHEGWEDTVKTPEFGTWLKSQPADVQALSTSEKAKDAIKLLDTYTAHQTKVAADETARQKREKRLAAAVTPTGTTGTPQTGINDDQAFERGFNRTRKPK